MKNKFIPLLAGIATLCIAVPVSVSAATPEEAAEVARSYGYTENEIQQAYNEYYLHPEQYPPETIDEIIVKIKESGDNMISTVPYNPDAQVPDVSTTTVTTDVQQAQTTVQETPDNGNDSPSDDTPSDNSTPDDNVTVSDDSNSTVSDGITLYTSDGTEFTRVSKDTFIALSYDDKMTYLSTFTPEQQQVIIDNLSPEEYRSILKQSPADVKADVIDSLSEVTDTLGMTLTVDEITDDSVQVSIKNSSGELAGVAKAGDIVENTGYDRRGILAVSGGLIVLAITGLLALLKNCFDTEGEYEGKK